MGTRKRIGQASPGSDYPAARKRSGRWLWALAGAGVLSTLALLLNSCTTFDQTSVSPPKIEGATFVGDKVCQDCHANITRAFAASTHARLRLETGTGAAASSCESCHGPASKHVAAGGAGRDKLIVNPGKDPQACFQCHMDVNAQFHLPQHHPLIEGKMNCVQCHDPHGLDIRKPAGGLASARLNETCGTCHREQTRPFVFEHAAMREGCTACHDPHGSINAKMLTVRDANLCLRCHAQVQMPGATSTFYIGKVDHSGYLRYGTCWTAGCHASVHGSNTQPYYFY